MISTKDSLSLRSKAATLFQIKNYQQGLIKQRRSILANPDDYKNYLKLAYFLLKLKKWEEVLEALKIQSQLCPEQILTYPYRIKCLKRLQRHEEAIELCQELIQRYPNGWRPYKLLGCILFSLQKYEEAIQAFKESVQRWAKSETYVEWAKALRLQGKYEEALEINREAVRKYPGSKLAMWNWGVILYYQLKFGEALEKINEAEALGYKKSDLHFVKGQVYYQMGEYEEARKLFAEGVEDEEVSMQSKIKYMNALKMEIQELQNRMEREGISETESEQLVRMVRGNWEIIDLIKEKENKSGSKSK